MNLQTTGPHQPKNPQPYGYTRRIPRGSSGGNDPLTRLERQATAHHRRIRGMKGKVKRKSDRKALESARLRLVEVLRTIAERPWEVSTGTHDIIAEAIAEARTIYAKAKKAGRHPRHGDRPAEVNGVRAKNDLKARYTGEEDGDHVGMVATNTMPSIDQIANDFQAELDASMLG